MRARSPGEFSPMPAVKTKASIPSKRGREHSGMQGHTINKIVERECGARIIAFGKLADVIADAGQALQAALSIKKTLDVSSGHALLGDEVKNDAGIKLAGPRAHRQPVERREAHRTFDALTVGQAHIDAPLPRWAMITRLFATSGATCFNRSATYS